MGKGGGASGARGGGGGGKVLSENTFNAKDLKGVKGRTGEASYSSTVQDYAESVASKVKDGDQVIIQKQWKDGTQTTQTWTVRESKTKLRDGREITNYDAELGGTSFTSYGFFGSGGRHGASLTAVISEGKSKVKSVTVTHKSGKKR